MELFTQLFIKALEGQKVEVTFSGGNFDLKESIESASVAALGRIREILKDVTLEDAECFKKIEAIVCEYEALGLDCGARHDFG